MEATVGAAWSGEAAIRDAEVMHSLFKWLKSIVVQDLYTCKLHLRRAVGQVDSRRDLDMRKMQRSAEPAAK